MAKTRLMTREQISETNKIFDTVIEEWIKALDEAKDAFDPESEDIERQANLYNHAVEVYNEKVYPIFKHHKMLYPLTEDRLICFLDAMDYSDEVDHMYRAYPEGQLYSDYID